jgi:hypothetical protein
VVGTVAWLLPQRAALPHAAWAVGLPLAAAAAVALVVRLPRHVAALLLVGLVGCDLLVSFGWWHRWRAESPTTERVAATIDPDVAPRWGPVPDAPGGIDRVAFAFAEPLRAVPDVPRATGAKEIPTVGGYDPLAPGPYLDVVGVDYRGAVDLPALALAPGSHVADLLRVTWVVGDDLVGRPREASLPEAFLVGEAVPSSRGGAVAAARGDVPLDPAATALVEGCDRCLRADEPGPAGSAGPVRWGASSATVPVVAERDAVLVLSQAWAPGWTATVDGAPAPVVRVDGVVQGVPVPPGDHVVELRHVPPGLLTGAAVSALTLLALLALSARSRATAARPAPPSRSAPPPTAGTSARSRPWPAPRRRP